MTANKRIVVNFLATYGRSLFALACGIFSGRWILAALGEVDYGLWGLVGGLTAFIAFLNDIMSGAISRYYAVSVGFKEKNQEEGLVECRKWFNTAITIHTVLSVALISIGYPLGVWAVRSFLTIPPDRVEACVWVWRTVCITCFAGMFSVPWRAMYTARQEIAELTIYSFVQTFVNIIAAYVMISFDYDWLVPYAWITCATTAIPSAIIIIRAAKLFPECIMVREFLFLRGRFKELWSFVMYRFWGVFADIVQNQGMSIIVNKFVGPQGNATMAVGRTVASQTVTLSNAMSTAIGPAIYNAYGEGNMTRVTKLAFQASKMGAILYLFIMIPAALEVDYLMKLWLVNPPALSAEICVFTMFAYLTERISDGQVTVIYATGNIARFQIVLCVSCFIGFFLALGFAFLGWGIIGIGIAIVLFKSIIMVARGYYARKLVGLSAWRWIREVIIPVGFSIVICYMLGMALKIFLAEGFARLIVSSVLSESIFFILVWFVICREEERKYLVDKVFGKLLGKVKRRFG